MAKQACCPIYSQRKKPSCGRADCDPRENPEHWVNAKLCLQHRRAPLLSVALAQVVEREFDLQSESRNYHDRDLRRWQRLTK